MTKRACDSCGRTYEAQRSTSKFCSDTCRKRGLRRGGSEAPAAVEAVGPVVLATIADLEALGLVSSRLGAQAIRLAAKLESTFDTGSAAAAVSKELDRLMDKAYASVVKSGDGVDEMKARRDAKRTRAAAG